jgi:hypothetical protein
LRTLSNRKQRLAILGRHALIFPGG